MNDVSQHQPAKGPNTFLGQFEWIEQRVQKGDRLPYHSLSLDGKSAAQALARQYKVRIALEDGRMVVGPAPKRNFFQKLFSLDFTT